MNIIIITLALALIPLLMTIHAIGNRGTVTGVDLTNKSWPTRIFLRWWYRMEDK